MARPHNRVTWIVDGKPLKSRWKSHADAYRFMRGITAQPFPKHWKVVTVWDGNRKPSNN